MSDERVKAELVASLKRRGMPVPRAPYQPAFAPYKRPPPRIIEDTRSPGELDAEDRAALLEMSDSGAPWEEIEAAYPSMTAKQLRMAIGRERGIRTRAENTAESRKLCIVCGEPHGRTGNAKRCLPCAREHERQAEADRAAKFLAAKTASDPAKYDGLCKECFRPHGRSRTAWYCLDCARKQKRRRALASNAARRERHRKEAAKVRARPRRKK